MNKELMLKLYDAGYDPGLGFGLSELIEACGEDFSKLHQFNIDEWQADAVGKFDGKIKEITRKGKTPEEAVANLWLQLKNETPV